MGIFSAISDMLSNPDFQDKLAGWGDALEGDTNAYGKYQGRVHARHAANAAVAADATADGSDPSAAPAPPPPPAPAPAPAPAPTPTAYNIYQPQGPQQQPPVDQFSPSDMIAKLLPRPGLPMQGQQQTPFGSGLGRRLY